MKSVAWVTADKGNTANVEEGADVLRAATLNYFLSSLEFGALWTAWCRTNSRTILLSQRTLDMLSVCLCDFYCLTHEGRADEYVVFCSCLPLGCS